MSAAAVGGVRQEPPGTDMLMRNSTTGAFEVYDISHNTVTSSAPMGAVDSEWPVAGFAADPPAAGSSGALIAQLAQATASFGASAAVNSAPSTILDDADTPQQTHLTMPLTMPH